MEVKRQLYCRTLIKLHARRLVEEEKNYLYNLRVSI